MLRGRTTTEVGPATVGSFAPCSLWLGALTHLSTPQGTHEYVQVPKRRASARPAPPHEHATGCGHGGSNGVQAATKVGGCAQGCCMEDPSLCMYGRRPSEQHEAYFEPGPRHTGHQSDAPPHTPHSNWLNSTGELTSRREGPRHTGHQSDDPPHTPHSKRLRVIGSSESSLRRAIGTKGAAYRLPCSFNPLGRARGTALKAQAELAKASSAMMERIMFSVGLRRNTQGGTLAAFAEKARWRDRAGSGVAPAALTKARVGGASGRTPRCPMGTQTDDSLRNRYVRP